MQHATEWKEDMKMPAVGRSFEEKGKAIWHLHTSRRYETSSKQGAQNVVRRTTALT